MMRLNKYLADCGVGARRKCDQLIADGKIIVNGVVETRLGTKIDEFSDTVIFDEQLIKPAQKFEYVLLNKPKGVITTASDEKNRKSVLDIVDIKDRIFPVGRLDKDTTGLLILTNDGDLAYKLTHPKYEIKKTYRVRLDKSLEDGHKSKIEAGVKLDEGITSHCSIVYHGTGDTKNLEITLHQGWNRQIRRMFFLFGYRVVSLKRISLGFLNLNGLEIGQWRRLNNQEVRLLKALTNGN